MTIIEALKALQNNGVENVEHATCTVGWSIDNLMDSINEAIAEDRLDDTSDSGEWVVDADGITQMDASGYRTSNRYITQAIAVLG